MNGAPFQGPHHGAGMPGLVDDHGPGAQGPDARAIASRLWAGRAWVAGCALAGGTLLFAVSLVLPPTFVADIVMLEAPRPSGHSALDQFGVSAQMLGLKPGGGTTNALTYPDILRSRRLLEGLLAKTFTRRNGSQVVLEEYILRGRPSPQRHEKATRLLRERFDITLDRRTNLLRLGVRDRDPLLAAAVANAAGATLQDLVMRSLMTQAGANRRFVETRLAEARAELARAEDAAERFRETNRHPDDSPRLLMVQGRLLRELRTREEVLIALTREYEMARVDENRDVPVLNVLDAAKTPAFRTSPRRGAMAAGGLVLGLFVGAGLAWTRRRPNESSEALAEAA